MRSIEQRLQLGLVLSLVLLMGLLWMVGNRAIGNLTEDFVTTRLEHDAESLLAALLLDPPRTRVRRQRVNAIYNQPFSGHYYLIRFPDGREISSRSLWDHKLQVPQLSLGETLQQTVAGPSGQRLLLWARGYRKQQQALTLAVAEDLTRVEERREQFQNQFILLALSGLAALLILQTIVVRLSFRRLEAVREDISRLEQGKTGRLSESVPSEILPLVQELNHLLELLAKRLERSRHALGNLAHALKGPLNLLIQYFDTPGGAADDGGRQMARQQTERIRQLMERELKRARLAGEGVQAQRFKAQTELPDLLQVLQQIHRERALELAWDAVDELPSFGDREDMLELLGNLLDNACKWASSMVRCRVRAGDQIEIMIEDDGRGLSGEDIERIAQRGARLDETVEGHGLGLAIARDIVSLYGGTMAFDKSPDLGGLQVAIRLPRHPLELE